MPGIMRAIVLDEPGPPENLRLRTVPVPVPATGWVRIRVRAFGLNRSELMTRQGLSPDVTFPRILGIEAVGTVDLDPDGLLEPGTSVATMMGGMGRAFDGSYAEYAVVPRQQILPFESALSWEQIGAIPETLQTAYGSLTTGLNLQAGQHFLIRGGTSALGLAAATLAREMGATVYATTRQQDRLGDLASHGVNYPLLDEGEIAQAVRDILPSGVDAALELVGTPTLPDTLRATRVHGVVCFSGMLSHQWVVKDFYPIDYLPNGVRLTAYSGEASDLPAAVLQRYLDAIERGASSLGPVTTYSLDQVPLAHEDLESGNQFGKLVVLT